MFWRSHLILLGVRRHPNCTSHAAQAPPRGDSPPLHSWRAPTLSIASTFSLSPQEQQIAKMNIFRSLFKEVRGPLAPHVSMLSVTSNTGSSDLWLIPTKGRRQGCHNNLPLSLGSSLDPRTHHSKASDSERSVNCDRGPGSRSHQTEQDGEDRLRARYVD